MALGESTADDRAYPADHTSERLLINDVQLAPACTDEYYELDDTYLWHFPVIGET